MGRPVGESRVQVGSRWCLRVQARAVWCVPSVYLRLGYLALVGYERAYCPSVSALEAFATRTSR